MREWVAALEEIVDHKLSKWKKENKIENGECVQLRWQFEQHHIQLDIFWQDAKETVVLKCFGPRAGHDFLWHGLNNSTFNKVMDRVGNLAQMVMHPAIDPDDRP